MLKAMHRCNPSTGGQGQEDPKSSLATEPSSELLDNERAFVKEIRPGTIEKDAPHPALTGMRYMCAHKHV